MTVLSIRDLTIRIAGRPLLDGANLQIDDGRKVGLVGRNGAGKSTLLRAITGDLQPDGGEIRLAARARMAHVAQEAPGGEECLLDIVLAADTERAALLAEADSHPDPTRLAEIHDRLIGIRADSAPGPRGGDPVGPRLRRGGAGAAIARILGRLADARGAGPRAVPRTGTAAARRTDQPSRPRSDDVAGRLAVALSRRCDRRQP